MLALIFFSENHLASRNVEFLNGPSISLRLKLVPYPKSDFVFLYFRLRYYVSVPQLPFLGSNKFCSPGSVYDPLSHFWVFFCSGVLICISGPIILQGSHMSSWIRPRIITHRPSGTSKANIPWGFIFLTVSQSLLWAVHIRSADAGVRYVVPLHYQLPGAQSGGWRCPNPTKNVMGHVMYTIDLVAPFDP